MYMYRCSSCGQRWKRVVRPNYALKSKYVRIYICKVEISGCNLRVCIMYEGRYLRSIKLTHIIDDKERGVFRFHGE